MMMHRLSASSVAFLALLLITLGCQQKPEAPKADVPKADTSATPQPKKEEPPPKPTIPQVALNAEQLATCVVKVGDTMPDAELPNLEGKPQSIRSLLGKQLTVLFFWTADNVYSVGELADMNDDIAKPLADKGVAVIGINRDAQSDKAKASVAQENVKFPVLLDPKGDYFGKVAKEKLLRTYLLDPAGKILWFDVEYSRSTRRDLQQAIDVALAGGK